jgi:hypothetical protein
MIYSLIINALGSLSSVLKPTQDRSRHQKQSRLHGLISPAEKKQQTMNHLTSHRLYVEHPKTHVTRTGHMGVLGFDRICRQCYIPVLLHYLLCINIWSGVITL